MRFFESLSGKVRPGTESVPPKSPSPKPGTDSFKPTKEPPSQSSAGASAPGLAAAPGREIAWQVLFVGGDPAWFRQVEQDMLRLQPNWFCHHTAAAAGAEAALESARFDALVVDGNIPRVDILLNQLERRINSLICLVRCDVSDRTTVAQWNRSRMTPVSMDAGAAALVSTLKRIESLRGWVSDPAMKKLLPLIRKLPTAPELYARVTEQLQSPNTSIQTVALLISQDPVMSAKILQVANSAFFGLTQEVTDTAEAVMVMGTERVRSLILLAGVFSQYDHAKCPGFSVEPIWKHSVQVAMFARAIAFGELNDAKIAETAFTAGLLHDIGKLVLAGNVPEMYEAVWRTQVNKKIPHREAEQMVLGTTHAEVGACLLAAWGLPLPILEAIAWHHEPVKSSEKGFSLLAAVHVANVFAQETGQGSGDATGDSINLAYLLQAGLGDCRTRWREFCGIASLPERKTPGENPGQGRALKKN